MARAHVLVEQTSPIGEKYILTDKYYILDEMVQHVQKIHPSAKSPKLMPAFIANIIAFIGKPISKLTGMPPLVTKSELNALRRKGRPNGVKIHEQLG